MPVFFSTMWLETQSANYGWLVSEREAGAGLAIPYVMRRRGSLRWLQLQWAPWSPSPVSVESEHLFLEDVVSWSRAQRYALIAQPPTFALMRTSPTDSLATPFGTFVLDITRDEEELFAGVHRKHRARIRRAEGAGLSSESDPRLTAEAHALCSSTMARSGLHFPRLPRLQRMLAGLGEHVDVRIGRVDGEPHAALISVLSRWGAHALYSGTAPDPAPGASNLLHWHAILHAKEHGAPSYDFMGVRLDPDPASKHGGIRRFKERFGGELIEGVLWKMPLVEWKYRLYRGLRHLRGKTDDVIDQETGSGG
jgi:hypothetical protein